MPRRRGRPPLLGLRGRPIELECPICHKTFSNKSNFDGHLTMHTPQRRRYRCDICNKSFLWRNNVYAHKRKIHNVPSSRELKLSLQSAPSLTITATSAPRDSAAVCAATASDRWNQAAMLPPSGYSASPSLLLLQAASAAWNESKEAQDK